MKHYHERNKKIMETMRNNNGNTMEKGVRHTSKEWIRLAKNSIMSKHTNATYRKE